MIRPPAIEARTRASSGVQRLHDFLETCDKRRGRLTAVSLFSGAGLSDLGYELAGFRFAVQVEIDPKRAALGQANFPKSRWIAADVRQACGQVVAAYREAEPDRPLDLLAATPPCQGMSSSNPSRGKRRTPKAKAQEEKNLLLLSIIPVALALKPRVIVVENVRQILTLHVGHESGEARAMDILRGKLEDYAFFEGVVNVADYGIPQSRRRAIVVGIRKDQSYLDKTQGGGFMPWPAPTHAQAPTDGRFPWVSLDEWFKAMNYQPLDAKAPETAKGKHELHHVPCYSGDRYLLVSQIPPRSGKSAYETEICPNCGATPVPENMATCSVCGGVMRNRPYVLENGIPRLIRGFHSSYRRMSPDEPAPTVTTNSSHVGSDYKIHPWENRVLSALECADLQTVPRWYDWSTALHSGRAYLVRQVVGEALPPYFTYLHGKVLANFLSGRSVPVKALAAGRRA